MNKLIFHHNKYAKKRYPIPDIFTFWNVTGEPHRVLEFIKNLMEFKYEFVVSSPLEHIMTQASILSVSQVDIHFVGRLKKVKAHLDLLMDHCGHKYLDRPQDVLRRMAGFGTMGLDKEPTYAKMMGLDGYRDGDLLPAYKAIADSYDAYQSLVEFFKQDFVCFGYEHDYNAFRENVYKKLEKQKQERQGKNRIGLKYPIKRKQKQH